MRLLRKKFYHNSLYYVFNDNKENHYNRQLVDAIFMSFHKDEKQLLMKHYGVNLANGSDKFDFKEKGILNNDLFNILCVFHTRLYTASKFVNKISLDEITNYFRNETVSIDRISRSNYITNLKTHQKSYYYNDEELNNVVELIEDPDVRIILKYTYGINTKIHTYEEICNILNIDEGLYESVIVYFGCIIDSLLKKVRSEAITDEDKVIDDKKDHLFCRECHSEYNPVIDYGKNKIEHVYYAKQLCGKCNKIYAKSKTIYNKMIRFNDYSKTEVLLALHLLKVKYPRQYDLINKRYFGNLDNPNYLLYMGKELGSQLTFAIEGVHIFLLEQRNNKNKFLENNHNFGFNDYEILSLKLIDSNLTVKEVSEILNVTYEEVLKCYINKLEYLSDYVDEIINELKLIDPNFLEIKLKRYVFENKKMMC